MKTHINKLLGFVPKSCLGARLMAAGMLLASIAAQAEEVTFQFTAQITRSINNPQAVGDTFTCQYTFDTATPDANPNDIRQGKYLDALTAVTLQTGATSHGLVGPLNRIFVHNNFGSRHDEYRMRAALSEGRSINLVLTDPSEQAIGSEALVATPPDLGAWATENVVVSWNNNGATALLEGVVTAFELVVPDSTPPTIALNGSSVVYVECALESYSEAGASASDDVDGNVAVTIGGDAVDTATLGTYVVTYNAVDVAGNQASQVTRTVVVRDTTAPQVSLRGPNPLYIECGIGSYVEYGVDRSDACDPTLPYSRSGVVNIDLNTLGSYPVRYRVVDDSGNETVIFRTVIVRDTTPPSIDVAAANRTEECDGAGNATDYAAWMAGNGGAQASDHCGAVTWTSTVLSTVSGCGATWVTEVRFTVTDASGNSSSTTATFRTIDTTVPILSWVGSDGSTTDSIVVRKKNLPLTIDFSAIDICDNKPVLALSWEATRTVGNFTTDASNLTTVSVDDKRGTVTLSNARANGTTLTITAVATDACGNKVTESVVVTVNNSNSGGGRGKKK
ncbi:MAG: immunoglobulin-like domain-containing protein [Limisphaerales bacterium]